MGANHCELLSGAVRVSPVKVSQGTIAPGAGFSHRVEKTMTALVTVIYLRGERSGQLGRSLGLWSATTHDALIRHALEGCGVPDGNIKAIQDSSRSFDSETGSAEEWAFAHGETVNSAYYVSKEGPVFYLELNAARQIGGRDGPR